MGPLRTHKHPNGTSLDGISNDIRGREVQRNNHDIIEEKDVVNDPKKHTWVTCPQRWIGKEPPEDGRYQIIRPEKQLAKP